MRIRVTTEMRISRITSWVAFAFSVATTPTLALQTVDGSATCPGGITCPAEYVSTPSPRLSNPWGETAEEALPKVRRSVRSAFNFFGAGRANSATGLWTWATEEKQLEERARDLHLWAALGDIDSQLRLGIAYFIGAGTFAHPHNMCVSARLFNAIAEKGSPLGMAALAYMHALGLGVVKNDERALHY